MALQTGKSLILRAIEELRDQGVPAPPGGQGPRRAGRRLLAPKQAKNGRTAPRHGGVGRASAAQGVDHLRDFGMLPRDGRLQVVPGFGQRPAEA